MEKFEELLIFKKKLHGNFYGCYIKETRFSGQKSRKAQVSYQVFEM
jgi:hypothetical protein